MPFLSVHPWKSLLLDLFFPRRCVGCGREGSYLCQHCIPQLPRVRPPLCQQCGAHLPQGTSCRTCSELPLSLEGIRSSFAYEHPLREAVLQFKYHGVRALGAELADLLARYLSAHPLPTDVLVPVPLHPDRRRERGYNQAEVLCDELGYGRGVPVAAQALLRVRSTPPQARANSREERRNNVAGAFAPGADSITGKRVLLIDDVCTTGATLNACGEVLREKGAALVWALTVAREA